ncbi:hypothetical protein IGI04_042673 [Brassica rapa subsp. trilocularis]|uniref:Uncharacterized protein n=1 Tax=Brassica rapa subsp. trilocularis TaxID=1813537 RepID=A0ABQ7KHQ3_BRACM|nr:hypothetical protein IGI04_042673 [Brassica rapa subsp. trilocularis]
MATSGEPKDGNDTRYPGSYYLTWQTCQKNALGGRGFWRLLEEGRPTKKGLFIGEYGHKKWWFGMLS